MKRQINAELDNIQLQFPFQAYLTLDDFAKLFQISRRNASIYLHRWGIPHRKVGKTITISATELAEWYVKHKLGGYAFKPIG